jgi:hypothetical protein
MTTTKNKRQLGENPAVDETEGIPLDGFQDPTGEYPKTNYMYGSSVNRAARGLKVNDLYLGGGDIGVSLNIEPQEPSQHPFNQVDETSSGHVVEYDDTPGGERILIRHRKGAGVEMRADGSVIVSAVNNRIEVTGGDQTTIIEGDGTLVYKGNLNLQVSGDYNVDVGGNYNINVAGHKNESIGQNHRTVTSGESEYITKKSRTTKTIEKSTDVVLGSKKTIVDGDYSIESEANIDIVSDKSIFMSGKDEWVAVSKTANISATKVSVLGITGSIGGSAIDFTGKVYQGPLGPVPFASGAAFYGSFFGQSMQSISTMYSNVAGGLSGVPITFYKMQLIPPSAPPPVAPIVGVHLLGGSYAIRNVTIDAGNKLRDQILLRDDYEGLFEKVPTTQELRSSFRDPANKAKLGAKMVGERRINPDYNNPSPPKIGRVSSKDPSPQFGKTLIGNPLRNLSKRFTP